MKRFLQLDFYFQFGLLILDIVNIILISVLQFNNPLPDWNIIFLCLYMVPVISYIVRLKLPYPKDLLFRISGMAILMQLTAPFWLGLILTLIFNLTHSKVFINIISFILLTSIKSIYIVHIYQTYRKYVLGKDQVETGKLMANELLAMADSLKSFLKIDYYIQATAAGFMILFLILGLIQQESLLIFAYLGTGGLQLFSFLIKLMIRYPKSWVYKLYGWVMMPVWLIISLAFLSSVFLKDLISEIELENIGEIILTYLISALFFSPVMAIIYVIDCYRSYRRFNYTYDTPQDEY